MRDSGNKVVENLELAKFFLKSPDFLRIFSTSKNLKKVWIFAARRRRISGCHLVPPKMTARIACVRLGGFLKTI